MSVRNPCKNCLFSNYYVCGKTGKRKKYYCINEHGGCNELVTYKEKHEQELEKRRKYKMSPETINSIDELLTYEWVWVFGKPKHMGFVSSLQLHLVSELIKRGAIHKVIEKKVEDK